MLCSVNFLDSVPNLTFLQSRIPLPFAEARSVKMDYDAMVIDQDATGPSVKISDVSILIFHYSLW